jgi:hypothetical protein
MVEMEGREDQDGAMREPTETCGQRAASPRHRYSCTDILGVASQKTTVPVFAAVKTSNLTKI